MPVRRTGRSPYDWDHRKLRALLIPKAIGTPCPARASPNCTRIMTNPALMQLDHSTAVALGGTRGDRIICTPCNAHLGAVLGNQLRAGTTPPPHHRRRRHTRRW